MVCGSKLYWCYLYIGECFQGELSIMERLKSFKTFFKVTLLKDIHLQVPFPSLNKVTPLEMTSTDIPSTLIAHNTDAKSIHTTRGEMHLDFYSRENIKGDSASKETNIVCEFDIDWKCLAKKFLIILEEAVSVRIHNAPDLPAYKSHEVNISYAYQMQYETGSQVVLGKAKIAILFSGGVDSVVLAALVDRSVQPLDLL